MEDQSNLCGSLKKLSYGLGHIFNDLCAAMWFSYTLFYLQVVLLMESKTAGVLLMIGQVVDSLVTPLAGWAIDRFNHKRLWHFIGTIAVAVGFSLIFSLKPREFDAWILIYYCLVITLFQIGWAVVQISHLSLIPEISPNHSYSSDLTAIRYTASVCCSICVYIITLLILKNNSTSSNIGPEDFFKFKEIAMIITFIGLISSVLFYCGLLGISTENDYEILGIPEDVNNLNEKNPSQHFLQSSVIYLVSLLYMASRLFTTLNLIYIPLYIDERGTLDGTLTDDIRQTIASIPLTCFIASFLTSILLKIRTNFCGDKVTYLIGTIFGLTASIWISIGLSVGSNTQLYIIAIIIGISGSSTMVASLCLTANYVKTNGHGGGFVYSIVTFTDKLISGAVVLLVQNLQCTPRNLCPHYYEHVLSYICGGVSLIGLLSLGLLQFQIRRNGRRN